MPTEDDRTAFEPAPGREWLSDLLANSRELAAIRLTPDGVIDGWFGASERVFGYASTEVLGQPFDVLFTAEDRAKGISRVELQMARATGRSEDERWHLRKDGSTFWAQGILSAQCDEHTGEVVGFAKVLRDRTDLRIGYETLQHRVDSLERVIGQRREQLLTLLHEMRNSLGPIIQASAVLSGDLPEDTRKKLAGVIARQSRGLARLLDDAVLSRSDTTEGLHLRPVVMKEAIRDAVACVEKQARDKSQNMLVFAPDTPVVIDADPEMLHRMLLNLISNAVKYTPQGGHIAVSGTIEGASAVIRVNDDGIGIEPASIASIFELFTREICEGATPQEGSGIGLAVVKRLAQLHGGIVEVRSAGRGKGSQFILQLPLRSSRNPAG